MQPGRKRLVLRCLLVLLASVGLAVALLKFNSYLDPFDDDLFDPVAWAAADEHERDRGPMARDALNKLPIGTPTARVRELLGEGEVIQAGGDRWGMRPLQHETWSYSLGCWSGLGPYGFDAAFLYVHFDSDGRVVATEITGE